MQQERSALYYMTKKLTLIHAIENKYDNKFERQSKVYLESLALKNPKLLEQADILFVQPTNNDIEQESIDFIQSYGAKFLKLIASTVQTNPNQNFTNNVNAINSVIDVIDTEYICWLDTDVLFLKPFELADTDAIVFSILPLEPASEITPYTTARQIDTAKDMNLLYQQYFKDYIPAEYKINKLDSYVNTWLTYGKRSSKFWNEWKTLTHLLIQIVHTHHPQQVELGLESISEELAASILYAMNKYQFENLSNFVGSNRTAMTFTTDAGLDLTADCCLLHYIGIMTLTMPELKGNFKQDSAMILKKMWDKGTTTTKDYLALLKDTV
jgi:hypothetical protein